MNRVEHLLGELRDAAQKMSPAKLTDAHYRMTLLKIDELDAWLTWTEVKAHSGQMPEDENATVMTQRLTDDNWFKLLEKHKSDHLIIQRDRDNNFMAEVREKGVLVIYRAPDLRHKDPDYVNAFLEAMAP